MNVMLRVFAGVIDALQFIFFVALLAFQFMGPIGGATVGAGSGAVLCWNLSTGVWESVKNATICAAGGGFSGTVFSILGGPIGIAIDVAISCTLGVLLLVGLFTTGRFYLLPVMMGFVGEMVPVVNGFAPFWSILVGRCIAEYKKEGKSAVTKSTFGRFLGGGVHTIVPTLGRTSDIVANQRYGPTSPGFGKTTQPARPTMLTAKNFEGVKPPTPANTNFAPSTQYAKTA